MAEIIQAIFITPPIAVARLGGSTTPQNAFNWVESPNPRSSGETTVAPDWSLAVQPDGTVEPFMPKVLQFRDGAMIRPVCPFFELWALMGEPGSARETWRETPLTPALLGAQGATLADLVIQVDAQNLKPARRASNRNLRFGTFPPVRRRADDNSPAPLLAVSPPGLTAAQRLIPANRNIPLGSFQMLKSRPQPAAGAAPWVGAVNVEVIRLRFTPARGLVYGPPSAAQPQPVPPIGPNSPQFRPVDPSRAFLNQNAGWAGFDAERNPFDPPQDTYDGADVDDAGPNPSLGVVDDTCEARIEATLRLPGNRTLAAAANVFVGPPDFAPDRRPFLSLADELNDRVGGGDARTQAMSPADRDAWVEDLFERIYETVSLFNVDLWRVRNGSGRGIPQLNANQLTNQIPGDQTREPRRAMGGRDALRNRLFPLQAESQDVRLPLTEHARMRHRSLSDLENLRDFIGQNPGRLAALIRPPFAVAPGESAEATTMQMPPFMRHSNAEPLTLAPWQYALLMAWVRDLEMPPPPPPIVPLAEAAGGEASPMSEAAAARRAEVLARIAAHEGQ